MTAPKKNEFIPVEQGELFYKQSGYGEEETIWIHGLPLTSASCDLQLDQLSGGETIKVIFADDDRTLMLMIPVPTLIISIHLGHEAPSKSALFLRQKIPNSHLFKLNDIDHLTDATKSSLINQSIEQFIFPSCDIQLPNLQE